MRGASALEQALGKSRREVSVVVVWEPVLPADFDGPPPPAVRARITDPRVKAFWDPGRLLSGHLVGIARAKPEGNLPIDPNLGDSPVVWDVVAIYPPGARWDGTIPRPAWYGNPVVEVANELAKRLR